MSMTELERRCVDAILGTARFGVTPTGGMIEAALNHTRAVLAEAGVAELVAAAKRSLQGWENAVELGLIPQRHTNNATILADELRAALAKIGATQ